MRYSLYQLAAAAGITPHVVRHHIRRGFVPYARGHADGAYYEDEHLQRLLAVQALRKRRVPLEKIRGVLEKMSPEEIRRLAGVQEPAPAVADAPPAQAAPAAGHQVWSRFPLAPGVELHVRLDAAGDALRMAQAFEKAWAQAKA